MALPTTEDAKKYLRVEHADEDIIVAQLLARSKATVETFVGYPLIAVAQTYVDYNGMYPSGAQWFGGYYGDLFELPGPYALSPAPVVTDANGVVIDATTYYLDNRAGKIRAKAGGYFGMRPYTVVATIGLSAHPDYLSRLEPIAALAVLDLVAHLYQNRNPAVVSESDEAGGSVGLSPDAIPPRIRQDLLLLPCTRGLILA